MALLTNINGKFSVSDVGAVTFNNAFTFPTADGAANYVLQTNGSGQLAWALNGNGDISGSGDSNYVTKFTGAKTIGNGPITFSGNNSTFAGTIDSGAITSAGKITGTELEGTSLDINGTAYIDGLLDVNSGAANTVAIFESTDDKAFIRIKDDDTDTYLISRNNKFSIGESDDDYDNFKVDISTGDATFAGDVSLAANKHILIGNDTGDAFNADSAIRIQDTGNAYVQIKTGDNNQGGVLVGDTADDYVGGFIYNNNTGDFKIQQNNVTALTISGTQNAAFAGTVTAPTFSGDLNGTINTVTTATTKGNSTNDTTVATTAFVQNVIGTIPAGLVFQGTWNASTNTPTLTSGSGTTGNFYIVSVAGSTNLDGITDWQVGDWAVFIEQGASDQWEKIDNSSVLSGSGIGGSFAGWSGSGTSVTLGNAPVTFSGNNSTFAGDIILAGNILLNGGVLYKNSGTIEIKAETIRIKGVTTNENLAVFNENGSVQLFYDNVEKFATTSTGISVLGTSSTFAGDVTIGSSGAGSDKTLNILTGGTKSSVKLMEAGTVYGFSTVYDGAANKFHINRHNNSAAGTSVLSLNRDDDNATFAGTISVASGTISVLGGNNMTLAGPASHGGISFATNSILPATAAATNDNVFDIGATTERFKDGYFGGTVTANNFVGGSGAYLPLTGGTMTGVTQFNDHTQHGDQVKSKFGAGNDLEIYHDGSNSYIQDTSGTGDLRVDTNTFRLRSANGGETMITAFEDGAVNLMHNDITRFSTTSAGISVTGAGVFTGDVSVEDNLYLTDAGTVRGKIQLNSSDRDDLDIKAVSLGSNMKFFTVDTERMRIDSSGRVGVANTNPSAFNSLGATAQIVIGDADAVSNLTMYSSASGYGSIAFADSNSSGSSSQYSGLIQYYQADNSMNFYTSAAPRMTILSGGNVGIGTISPGYKLTVAGDAGFSDWIYASKFYPTSGTTDILMQTGAGRTITLDPTSTGKVLMPNGNVGIGTTDPLGKLMIRDDTAGAPTRLIVSNGGTVQAGTTARLSFYEGTSEKGYIERRRDGSGKIAFVTPADDNPFVWENPTGEIMRINNSNVGIGVDPSGNTDRLQIDNPANPTSIRIGDNTTDDCYIVFNTDGNDWSIGTDRSDSNKFKISDYSRVGTNDRLVIDGNGNVGIGTTSPTSLSANTSSLSVNSTRTDLSGALFQKSNGVLKFQQYWSTAGIIADVSAGDYFWKLANVNKMGLDTGTGALTVVGDIVAYGSPSDKRLKENIKPIESALEKVSKLQGVTFDWKESDSILDIKEDIGFIAQDVQKVIPELVRENDNGMLSMRHQGIAPILLEAIKELKAEIEELKKCKYDCKR